MGTGLGGFAGFELLDEVAHLLWSEVLAGAHCGVTGERGSDAQAGIDGGVLAGEEVEELDEGASRVVAAQTGGCGAQERASTAEGLDGETMGFEGAAEGCDEGRLHRREVEDDGREQGL